MESYNHIELTEDEVIEGTIWAKRKKEALLEKQNKERIADENRKALTGYTWDVEQTAGYMMYRAAEVFKGKFQLDEYNKPIYNLLCHYFSLDERFVSLAEGMGIKNASLEKGIFLAGNFGTGKTMIMKLFSRNQRQCFEIVTARTIADAFSNDSDESLLEYIYPYKNAVNDKSRFLQPITGHCFDDLGAEEIKNHYGNKKNVLEDVIEKKYSAQKTGILLHATTNLSAEKLNEFYGGRVVSRMREIFNFIPMKGKDRRI